MLLAVLLGLSASLIALLALLRLVSSGPAFERLYYATAYAVISGGLTVALFQVPLS